MKRILYLCIITLWSVATWAHTEVTITDPASWTVHELSAYIGQTVTFTTPFYVCNNYRDLVISPRRTMVPTNQAEPKTDAYYAQIEVNKTGELTLTGVSGYHRLGERIENLTVYVSSTQSVQAVGAQKFVGNTRADLQKGYPSVDMVGEHDLLVCAFNLEYYLVSNLGTGYGPDDQTQANRQHAKIMDALEHIQADIFGFVEIEQGQDALKKLAESLTAATGRQYSWVNDGGTSSGSYTKSGYMYCTETVEPYGGIRSNDIGVRNRKKMQGFRDKKSGETFIFSLNHFKAKSGAGLGSDEDKGDGQGSYNGTRVREAQSVLSQYSTNKNYYKDEDILIMGDLNAYAKEDPIMTLVNGGMTDLFRHFHADSAYSYVYYQYAERQNQAGYLDHALVNETMLAQVTGVQAYHINSDESDSYTYDKSSDLTMFRSSDHDPVLVGLAFGDRAAVIPDASFDACKIDVLNGQLTILSAQDGYYRIYDMMGNLWQMRKINNREEVITLPSSGVVYIVQVVVEGKIRTFRVCN